MNNEESIQRILNNIRYRQTEELIADEDSIRENLRAHAGIYTNITIKGLSIAGGILASMAFLTFLGLAKLLSSETGLLITGLLFFGGSVIASRRSIHLLLDTGIICFYILAYILVGMGLYGLTGSGDYVILIFLAMSLLCFVFTDNFFLVMLSVMVFIGSLIAWLIIQDAWSLIQLPVMLTGVSLFLLCFYEPAILAHNRKSNISFKALQAGFFLSFLLSLVFMAHAAYADIIIHRQWMLSVFIWAGIFLLVNRLMKKHAVSHPGTKLLIYVPVILLIIPTLFAPYLCGSVFLMLLTFAYGYRTEFVAGCLLFIFAVIRYYYDLNLTLLNKSIILFLTGLLFISAWLLYRKKSGAL